MQSTLRERLEQFSHPNQAVLADHAARKPAGGPSPIMRPPVSLNARTTAIEGPARAGHSVFGQSDTGIRNDTPVTGALTHGSAACVVCVAGKRQASFRMRPLSRGRSPSLRTANYRNGCTKP